MALVFTLVFSGRDKNIEPIIQTTDVCVLLGDFSNAKDADLSVISKGIDPTKNATVNFTVFVLDGKPEDTVLTCNYDNGNRTSPDIIRNHYSKFLKNDLTVKINNALPEQEETDILRGLEMAEKHLSNS